MVVISYNKGHKCFVINTSSYDKLQIYVHTKKFMFNLFKRRYVPMC